MMRKTLLQSHRGDRLGVVSLLDTQAVALVADLRRAVRARTEAPNNDETAGDREDERNDTEDVQPSPRSVHPSKLAAHTGRAVSLDSLRSAGVDIRR